MEASSGEIGLGKTEGGGSKGGSRKETRGKGEEKETEERKNGRGQEDSGGVGNLRGKRRGSNIRDRSKENSARKVSSIDKSLWKKTI